MRRLLRVNQKCGATPKSDREAKKSLKVKHTDWERRIKTLIRNTHELINLHISAMAYYINTLDGERSVHGRCEPKCFKDGDLF